MNLGGRTIFLTAAIGAAVLGGSGVASAAPGGVGHDGHGRQINDCSTSTLLGDVNVGPLSVASVGTECVNYSRSGVKEQINNCDSHSVVGPITIAANGKLDSGTKCLNYSETSVAPGKQVNHCRTTSTLGPLDLASNAELDTGSRCANVAGAGGPGY